MGKIPRIVTVLVCCVLIVSLIGCATIVKGNTQLVTVNSEPSGAKVKIDGLKGTTPYTATLSRGNDYVVEVSKDGYETEQRQVTHHFGALSIFGNLPWLLIGVIVDFASGSAYNLNPTNVNVELEKESK